MKLLARESDGEAGHDRSPSTAVQARKIHCCRSAVSTASIATPAQRSSFAVGRWNLSLLVAWRITGVAGWESLSGTHTECATLMACMQANVGADVSGRNGATCGLERNPPGRDLGVLLRLIKSGHVDDLWCSERRVEWLHGMMVWTFWKEGVDEG